MCADKKRMLIRGTADKLVFWGLALSIFLLVFVRYYVKGQDILESFLLMLMVWLMLIFHDYTETGSAGADWLERKFPFPRLWKFQRRALYIMATVASVGLIVGYVGKHFFG